jgi:hypothetical protein
MIDLFSDRAPQGYPPAGADFRPGRMSFSYAPSEIIVKIIGISEKCPSGFFLITQVTALVQGRRTF